MRVIAGSLGGRTFEAPSGPQTHPMGDKIRGALFNALGDIQGLRILDAYSGSGAISFEAISRGATQAVAVENDKDAQSTIKKNLKLLNLSDVIELAHNGVKTWSGRNKDRLFDIIICDPPYGDIRRDHLRMLALHLKVGGVVVYSLPPTVDIGLDSSLFSLLAHKSYGDATLFFYRRNGSFA